METTIYDLRRLRSSQEELYPSRLLQNCERHRSPTKTILLNSLLRFINYTRLAKRQAKAQEKAQALAKEQAEEPLSQSLAQALAQAQAEAQSLAKQQAGAQRNIDEPLARLITHYPSAVVLILSSTDETKDDELLKNVLMYALWGKHKKNYYNSNSLYSDTRTDRQRQLEKTRIIRAVIELLQTLSLNAELLIDVVLPGAAAVHKISSLISVANQTEALWLQHIVKHQIRTLPSAGAGAARIAAAMAASSGARQKKSEVKSVVTQYKIVHRPDIVPGMQNSAQYHIGSTKGDCCVCATQYGSPSKYKAIEDAFILDKTTKGMEQSYYTLGILTISEVRQGLRKKVVKMLQKRQTPRAPRTFDALQCTIEFR